MLRKLKYGLLYHKETYFSSLRRKNVLDYTIGSVHYFCKDDELLIEAEFPSKWIFKYDDVKEVRI